MLNFSEGDMLVGIDYRKRFRLESNEESVAQKPNGVQWGRSMEV